MSVRLGRILLVDDVPGERANFEAAFGSHLTVAPSIDQLNSCLSRQLQWDVAFVDFNLSSPTSTGLTALLRLHHERPGTKIVTYSQFTENGRTLYAAAAKHWFGANALMDKTKNEPENLIRYVRLLSTNANPTPAAWQQRLQWAALIDNLLAEPSWVRIWQAIRDAAGEMARVAELLNVDVRSLRTFKDRATAAAISFNEKFLDIPSPGETRNKKGILSAFASEHRHFLTAPDLSVAMSPGSRRRRVTGPGVAGPGARVVGRG
jgi:CheY-like chemotaxis protein